MNIYNKLRPKTWVWFVTISVLGVLLTACGESDNEEMDTAVQSLKTYYGDHSPPRGWTIKDISSSTDGSLHIDLAVKSEADALQIKSRSPMERFNIARMGCPKATSELQKSIHGETKVWVHLLSEKGALVSSICPSLGQ